MESAGKLSDSPQSTLDELLDQILLDLKKDRLSLPVLPQVASGIYQGINDKDINAKELAKFVAVEPALSARILQVANSPLVRGNSKIDNLHYAITRMGNTLVHTIIVSFLVKQLFRSPNVVLHQILCDLWQHCCHVAAISHILAKNFTRLSAEEAMLAGLLHDIGKLPILSKATQNPTLAHNKPLLESIMEQLHGQLGKIILKTWNAGEQFIAVAVEHENLLRDSEKPDLVDVVLVANLHSHAGDHHYQGLDWSTIPAMQKLNIDVDRSMALLDAAKKDVILIKELLQG
ncbi:MAG: HDOD domain-containing protein [Gammaproteobacteria bacterium]|nr:HDOD domain-containing protein [Gammaproteobacteria bacterium]MDH5801019.1 HDOD domain-containing protein [Gammaproteobacteria bacterium]